MKRTALQIAPRLYGYGVGQLSFLVSTRTLAALGDAFVTYNFCAWRVTDFVLGGFVVSLTRTILPSLSDQALEKDRSAYKATVAFALRLIGFVTIPSMVGLMLLAAPIVDVIFRRGRFGDGDVAKTALAVVFFALGLYAAAGVKIVTQAFYALHDTRTPVLVATFDLAVFWAALRCARRADAARGRRPRDVGGVLDQLPRASRPAEEAARRAGRARDRGRRSSGSLSRASGWERSCGLSAEARAVPDGLGPSRSGSDGSRRVAALGAAAFFVFAKLLRAPEVDEVLGALRRKQPS